MLFRIASDSYAEISVISFQSSAASVCAASLIASDALYQFACISVSARSRGETLFTRDAVTSQCNDVIDSQESKIVQPAFYLFLSGSSAYQMRHYLHIVS